MSSVKEPHFFISDYGPKAKLFPHAIDEKKYLSLFNRRNSEHILGEASPSYLWDESAAEKIYRKAPDAKIVVLIRDPIERAYSQFLHYLRSGYETNNDFLSAVKTDYCNKDKKG